MKYFPEHPACLCTEPVCPTTPNGFNAKVCFVSAVPESEIIGSPSDHILKTKYCANSTSQISKEDAEAKALEEAKRVAALRMSYLISRHYPSA